MSGSNYRSRPSWRGDRQGWDRGGRGGDRGGNTSGPSNWNGGGGGDGGGGGGGGGHGSDTRRGARGANHHGRPAAVHNNSNFWKRGVTNSQANSLKIRVTCFPSTTKVKELKDFFQKFGELERVEIDQNDTGVAYITYRYGFSSLS